MKHLVGIVLLLCFPWLAKSQNWQPVGLAEGLSQGMVYDLVQDQQGFLWIATKDGLNRYDGYNFKVFTNDPYNPFSISGNTCTALLYDSKGRLWIGTEKDGLNLYNPVNQQFYRINVKQQEHAGGGNYNILQLEEDKTGAIWIVTDQASVQFKITIPSEFVVETEAVLRLTLSPLSPSVVPPVTPHQHVGLQGKVAQNLCGFLGKWIEGKPQQRDFYILQDHQQNQWVLLDKELICWKDSIRKTIPLVEGAYKKMYHFRDGIIAICDQHHLWLMPPQELLKQDSLTSKNAYALVPDSRRINTIRKDNVGNIWLGTRGYGLYKFNPRIRQFNAKLPTFSPSYLFQDAQGRVYFHGNAKPGYQYYQLESPTTYHPISPAVASVRYSHDYLLQDRKQQFWLLAREDTVRCLFKFTKDWQLVQRYVLPAAYHESPYSAKLVEDHQGNIWVGLVNGQLVRFDPITAQFKVFSYKSLLPQSGATIEVLSMYQSAPNVCWIGTQKGLVKVDNFLTAPTFSIFKNNPNERFSLSNDVVSGCVNDPVQPDKYLWVSTKGGGLERLDKQTGTFEHFTEKQGLPNKVVYGVLVGDDQNLWMSTNRGLARLNPKSLVFTNFNKSDGLQDDEFNTNSYFKAPSGELLFGGINGFNVFRPSQIGKTTTPPTLRLLSLKVNNIPIEVADESGLLDQAIEYLPPIELAHNQNQLAIEFGLMDFTNPVKNRFRYQLEGIDNEWVETGTNHVANFAQLPSGSYTLRVIGTTDGENWSKPVELSIRIHPPFYRTWWAYLLYLLAIGYLVYRWNQNQLNRVRLQQQLLYKDKEAERLAELDAIKTNFFANISHEFRTPLTLILGPVEQMLNDYPNDGRFPLVRRNAQRLLALINQLLDISKLEAGQIQPELTHLEVVRYFRTLMSSFTSLAESRQITFEVSQNQQEVWGYLDTDKTEKMMTNLLSNAFKFTNQGGSVRVEVSYGAGNRQAEIKIADTGIGIKADKLGQIFNRFYQVESDQRRSYEGTGIGLALVKELVEVLKGKIRVESQEGAGTTFWVELPIDEHTWANYPKTSHERIPKPFIEQLPVATITPTDLLANENILLLIDDNADIRAYVRQIFEPEYQIVEAQDGEEGLAQAMAYVPNLIISDLMMPRMDGFEFCRRLKSNEKTSHIPVIMLTAKANVESRIEGFELGADDYLVKPFNTAEIKARVKNLLDKQEKLRQYFNGKTMELKPSEIRVNSMDEAFLGKVKVIMEQQLSNSAFSVVDFAEAMNMSKSQLNRKLNALTSQSSNELLRDFRLQRAAELLSQRAGTVSEIAYQVGFEHLSYFAKSFQERYGKLPSEYP
ncbi:MAG: response regulator [Spirosomataceae bacterium]